MDYNDLEANLMEARNPLREHQEQHWHWQGDPSWRYDKSQKVGYDTWSTCCHKKNNIEISLLDHLSLSKVSSFYFYFCIPVFQICEVRARVVSLSRI